MFRKALSPLLDGMGRGVLMMAIMTEDGRHRTATARAEAARRRTDQALTRELLWATHASYRWPSCLMAPAKPQPAFPALLVIDTPVGRVVYRLTAEELESGLYAHLGDIRPNDKKPADDKIGVLWQLAQGAL